MRPENSEELKRNYLILFAILFGFGIIVILQSYNINLSLLIDIDQYQIVLGCISWIAAGSILSLISGYAIVKLLLKDIEHQKQERGTPERKGSECEGVCAEPANMIECV